MPYIGQAYGELIRMGSLRNVKNRNIGLGLSNSIIFAEVLGGSIEFEKTEPGDTVV